MLGGERSRSWKVRYVSFHTPFLPRLGISRAHLIDSLPNRAAVLHP